MARHEAAGAKVRELKAAKADKADVDTALATLLACKGEYKTLTGNDYPAPGKQSSKGDKKAAGPAAPAAADSYEHTYHCRLRFRVCICLSTFYW